LVGRVIEGEPAAEAGFANKDVIIELGGESIEDAKDLLNTVARLKPGAKAEVVVLRDGEKRTFEVELGERSIEMETARREEPETEDRLGLTVQEVTPDLAERLGLEKAGGVIVSNVRPGSAAAGAGIRRNYVILEIEKNRIEDLQDYRRALSEIEGEESVLLWIQRGDSRIYIVVHLGG
jgi:serine protease Do